MNLYNFHTKPESLDNYAQVYDGNPDFFWQKYKDNPEELKKREKYIARDPEYAYIYARHSLNVPFPLGEAEIATSKHYSHLYAKNVLRADFYYNGKLIAKAR